MASSDNGPVRLKEVVVEGRADSLTGVAESAAQGTVGQKQLELRPILRGGEVLETVPGVIITQHAGGGKANQYFLRGFNLDHGTDFAVDLDGMPLNLRTHAHGQGYSDMNIVIPELVQRVNYEKGVYFAHNGDFASAGAAHLQFYQTLPKSLALVEGGMYGYGRLLFASSPKVGDGHLLYGFEVSHGDGPWAKPDDFQKFNGILSYSQGDETQGFSVTGRGYHGKWNSSDQVAASAISSGLIDFYDSLDHTTGGNSQRYSVEGEWHRRGEDSETKVMGYVFYYDLDLFSNFTYFLADPNLGDQFEQADRRWVIGVDASHTMFNQWWGREVENTVGLQIRNDWIDNGLFQTQGRIRTDKTDVTHGGAILPATTRADSIAETSTGVYYENKIQWAEKVRSVAGLRGDFYNFNVDSNRPQNSGDDTAIVGSPKLSLIFGPWSKTELYVQGGLGFHSNDARGVLTRVDPVTGTTTNLDGDLVKKASPLVQTYGAEIGVRTTHFEGLQSTLSFWWLDIDSELVFAGDAGTTEAGRPSRRYGVEFANYYDVTNHITLDADFSFSHAEFRDNAIDPSSGLPVGKEIPGSVESVISGGITYRADCGFSSSLRLRYFGPRPLIEDNSSRSSDTFLLNALVGYQINNTWKISVEFLNLLDSKAHDIDYFYESRVRPVDMPAEQIHFHPVEPFQVRFAVSARF